MSGHKPVLGRKAMPQKFEGFSIKPLQPTKKGKAFSENGQGKDFL